MHRKGGTPSISNVSIGVKSLSSRKQVEILLQKQCDELVPAFHTNSPISSYEYRNNLDTKYARSHFIHSYAAKFACKEILLKIFLKPFGDIKYLHI